MQALGIEGDKGTHRLAGETRVYQMTARKCPVENCPWGLPINPALPDTDPKGRPVFEEQRMCPWGPKPVAQRWQRAPHHSGKEPAQRVTGLPSVLGTPASESPPHARDRVWMPVSGFFASAGPQIRAKRHLVTRSQLNSLVTRETS